MLGYGRVVSAAAKKDVPIERRLQRLFPFPLGLLLGFQDGRGHSRVVRGRRRRSLVARTATTPTPDATATLLVPLEGGRVFEAYQARVALEGPHGGVRGGVLLLLVPGAEGGPAPGMRAGEGLLLCVNPLVLDPLGLGPEAAAAVATSLRPLPDVHQHVQVEVGRLAEASPAAEGAREAAAVAGGLVGADHMLPQLGCVGVVGGGGGGGAKGAGGRGGVGLQVEAEGVGRGEAGVAEVAAVLAAAGFGFWSWSAEGNCRRDRRE